MPMLLRLIVPVVLALQAAGGNNAPTTPVPTDGGRAIAGRPPIGPLQRTDPRIYDVSFGVTLFTELPPTDASLRAVIDVTDAPFVLPVIDGFGVNLVWFGLITIVAIEIIGRGITLIAAAWVLREVEHGHPLAA